MARRYWSINIPRFKAGTLVELAKIIYSRHKDDGEESILGVFDMEKFDQDATEAEILRKKAAALKRESEELMQRSRKLLGIDKEQSSYLLVPKLPSIFSFPNSGLGMPGKKNSVLNNWIKKSKQSFLSFYVPKQEFGTSDISNS